MAEEGFRRKLTAILSADVEGYSRLMGDDEEATIRTLTKYRNAMTDLVQKYRGRVVDAPGDNLLAEFVSVVDAVNCAVEIQRELSERNADLPDNRKMQFRIGVNLGDVVEEEGRLYGDGVNIAARVEGLAEAGGICISGRAYDQVENKLGLEYENLGEHEVKNIARPIRVYRVLSFPGAAAHRVIQAKEVVGKKWRKFVLGGAAVVVVGAIAVMVWNFYFRLPPLEPASVERMAFKLPDKPSIAVLPFVNMSGDPNQEYFSDGITEDLITDLSSISNLFVIARNSTFTYKGKPVKIRQVAEELGVRYVLEGSVRKADNQVRINAQLIDATTGHHLWAKRYDGHMGDVFALQDKITKKIVSALRVKLTTGKQKPVDQKETDNIEAYDAFLKGWGYYIRYTPGDFAKAIPYFEKAIELDSNYGRAYAALAKTFWNGSQFQIGFHKAIRVSWMEARVRAREYLKTAMKSPTSIVLALSSEMNLAQRLHEEAIAEAQRAIELDPNDSISHLTMAKALIFAGREEEADDFINKAMRLDPHNIAYPLYLRGLAYFALGHLNEAVTLAERALTHNPEISRGAGVLAAAYAHLGRDQKARAALDNYTKDFYRPWQTILYYAMYNWPFQDLEVADRFADGLIRAGMPGQFYYKVSKENKLSGEEIRDLFLGRTMEGFFNWGGAYWIERTRDGKASWRHPKGSVHGYNDNGTSWIEGDMLCDHWQMHWFGIKHCRTVFRNPEGTPEKRNEYLTITDFWIEPFSPVN